MKLIADVGFDQSFSFLYSRRPGTPAASLPDEVPHEVKQRRLELMQQRLNAQARGISQRMVGSRAARADRAAREARCGAAGGPHRQQPLGQFRRARARSSLINRFADVIITEARPNSLRGRLVVESLP